MYRSLFLFIFSALLSSPSNAHFVFGDKEFTEFKLVKSSDGIELYEKWYPYGNGQDARELKAVCEISAPFSKALALLKDYDRIKEWNSTIDRAELKPISSVNWLACVRYDVPWPFDDQDCVLKYTLISYPDGTRQIDFVTVKDPSFPEYPGISRMNFVKGKWLFKQKNGKLHLEYYITTEPSQTLPRWISDPIVRSNIVSMITSFRDYLEENN